MWIVDFSEEFSGWIDQQESDLKIESLARLRLLEETGPLLGRPYADTLKGTSLRNLKELRFEHKRRPIRIFFAFDSIRQAYVICAGSKSGDKNFYETMIPVAEKIFLRHEQVLRNKR